jgi:hypothetical protein
MSAGTVDKPGYGAVSTVRFWWEWTYLSWSVKNSVRVVFS